MRKHFPIQQHFRNMQRIARHQRYERRHPDSPRKAHRRAVQAAVKQMRDKFYSRCASRTIKKRRSICADGPISQDELFSRSPSEVTMASDIDDNRPRYHPP